MAFIPSHVPHACAPLTAAPEGALASLLTSDPGWSSALERSGHVAERVTGEWTWAGPGPGARGPGEAAWGRRASVNRMVGVRAPHHEDGPPVRQGEMGSIPDRAGRGGIARLGYWGPGGPCRAIVGPVKRAVFRGHSVWLCGRAPSGRGLVTMSTCAGPVRSVSWCDLCVCVCVSSCVYEWCVSVSTCVCVCDMSRVFMCVCGCISWACVSVHERVWVCSVSVCVLVSGCLVSAWE